MKTRISVQERLKDLRVEQGLNLEELAQKTGISKSALGSYENDNDEYKEINHGSLLKLATRHLRKLACYIFNRQVQRENIRQSCGLVFLLAG